MIDITHIISLVKLITPTKYIPIFTNCIGIIIMQVYTKYAEVIKWLN